MRSINTTTTLETVKRSSLIIMPEPVMSQQIVEERHKSLYLPDGDLVVSASRKLNRAVIVLFRVDKICLVRHSKMFKDMLSVLNVDHAPVNGQYDGVPRVHLSDDADDLAGLFAAMYDPTTLPLVRLNPDTPLLVYGIMRLAVKYDVKAIRKLIFDHIEADWPRNLGQWNRRQNEMARLFFVDGTFESAEILSTRYEYLDNKFPEAVAAIRFAQTFDCPSILPAALYQLLQFDQGVNWDDRNKNAPVRDDTSFALRSTRWKMLKPSEVLAVTSLTKHIANEWWPRVFRNLKDVLERCPKAPDYNGTMASTPCLRAFVIVLELFTSEQQKSSDPFGSLLAFWECNRERWTADLCKPCRAALEHTIHRECQDLWDKLPQLFATNS